MALYAKKGKTTLNPSVVTDGLIYYIDPNNKLCVDNSGREFTDLIRSFSSTTDLSAGKLNSLTNSLTSLRNNTFFAVNTSDKYIFGNILSNLSLNDCTIQFWFKNNRNLSGNRLFFSSFNPILSTTNSVSFSSNYPFNNFYSNNNASVISEYSRQPGLYNTKPFYRKPNFNTFGLTPHLIWENNKWNVTSNNPTAANRFNYFSSNDNTPIPNNTTNWVSNITAVELSGTANSFSILNQGRELLAFKENILPTSELNYSTRAEFSDFYIFKNSTSDYFYIFSFNQYNGVLYKGKDIKQYPWETTYTSLFSCLKTISDVYIDFLPDYRVNLSGTYIDYNDNIFGNVSYIKTKIGTTNFNPFEVFEESYVYYADPSDGFSPVQNPSWVYATYIFWGFGGVSYWYTLSSSEINKAPHLITNWEKFAPNFNGSIVSPSNFEWQKVKFNSGSLSTSLIVNDVISASPKFYENITSYVSSVNVFVNNSLNNFGFSISGSRNRLNFFNNDFATKTDSNFNTFLDWNCVTLAKSGRNITLYKNSYPNSFSTSTTNILNISGIIFNQEMLLGQVLIYNKCLSSIEVKQNYDAFKNRYGLKEYIAPKILLPTGGLINYYERDGETWVSHTFLQDGNFTTFIEIPSARYLVVGGGGGSAFDVAGGGGGGAVLSGSAILPKSSYPVKVGEGGDPALDMGSGSNYISGGIFTDNSLNKIRLSNSGVRYDNRKYPGSLLLGSGFFNGNSLLASNQASNALDLSEGDFTIELFANVVDPASKNHTFIQIGSSMSDRINLSLVNGVLTLYVEGAGGEWLGSNTTFPNNTWSSIALTRQGNTYRLYQNGSLVGTRSGNINFLQTGPKLLHLGTNGFSRNSFNSLYGLLDDVRVTKGIARYTSSFFSPAAFSLPYTIDPFYFSNVSFLCYMEPPTESNGGASIFYNLTALGGGAGGRWSNGGGNSGSSGGGGSGFTSSGGFGFPILGFSGGNANTNNFSCGGGGGARQIGFNSSLGSSGGRGAESDIAGSFVFYGGGGGGGRNLSSEISIGGLGGGGRGAGRGSGSLFSIPNTFVTTSDNIIYNLSVVPSTVPTLSAGEHLILLTQGVNPASGFTFKITEVLSNSFRMINKNPLIPFSNVAPTYQVIHAINQDGIDGTGGGAGGNGGREFIGRNGGSGTVIITYPLNNVIFY